MVNRDIVELAMSAQLEISARLADLIKTRIRTSLSESTMGPASGVKSARPYDN